MYSRKVKIWDLAKLTILDIYAAKTNYVLLLNPDTKFRKRYGEYY